MTRLSAGLLLFKRDGHDRVLKLLIAHMGGPFWAAKDERAWSIPKGEYSEGEDPLDAAVREFAEELGSPAPPGETLSLGSIRQPSGKRVTAFAREADYDASAIRSNEFELEWPRGSGRVRSFPEVDRAEWVATSTARVRLVKGQVPFVDQLHELLQARGVRFSD